jgi:hypothetical protein
MISKNHIAATLRAGAIVFSVVAVACAREPRLEGRYSAKNKNMANFVFKDAHRVNMVLSQMGTTLELEYALNGKEITLKTPEGTLVGTIRDDGCIVFGGGLEPLCKDET